MKYSNLFLSGLIFCTVSNAAEVSVFGAGNLESSNPYGLNSTEKHIYKNKKELETFDTKIKRVNTKIDDLSERLDGIESIYEGDSQKLNSLSIQVKKFTKTSEENQNQNVKDRLDIDNIKKVVDQMLVIQEENTAQNKKNIDSMKLIIKDLTRLVNEINSKYVSDSELRSNMKQFVTRKEFENLKKVLLKSLPNVSVPRTSSTTSTKTTSSSNTSNKSFEEMKKSEVITKARNYFKKDYFTKAIPMFEYLVKVNYRPAESNFYLGEMWYYRKKYQKAIDYFKRSAILYDKASYMPKLMLHSAISFEKIGEKENAINFYSTLTDLYPKSKEAKEAKNKLSKLN
jgi:TolA-binding protein